MNVQDPVAAAGRKVQQTWLQDGIAEIVLSLVLLVPAAQIALEQRMPHGPARNTVLMALVLVFMTSGFWARWLTTRLRNRLVGARAGYWVPRSHVRLKPAVSGAVAAALLAALIAVYMKTGRIPGWFMVGFTGVAGGLLLGMTAHASGMRRLWIVAGLCGAGGVAAACAAPDMNTGFVWLFVCMAALSFASGLWALRSFLRRAG